MSEKVSPPTEHKIQYLIVQKFIIFLQFLAKIIYQYLIVQFFLIFGMDDSPLVQCQVEHEEYFRDIRADSKNNISLKIPMQSRPHRGTKEPFRYLSHYKYYLFKILSFIGKSHKNT